MELKEILQSFCLCGTPSGAESAIYSAAAQVMEPFGNCQTDKRGNFICTKEGSGTHYLLDAHMDQIGFAVTAIEDNGFLKVDKVGGMDRRILPSLEVTVLGREPVYGVISCKPPHLTDESEKNKAAKFEDICIDTGLPGEVLREKVSLGDKVVLKPYFGAMCGGNVTGTAIDDRAGMAILVRVMELLQKNNAQAKITAVFSVGEEVGGKGADCASYAAEAAEAIAVDVSFASQPEIDGAHKNAAMPLGGGAFIGVAPILSKQMSEDLIATAKQEIIPYRVEVMGGRTGTNADGLACAKYGTKTVTVSPPIRNMHTGVEVVHLDDLEQCARLIAAYILSKEGKACAI